MRARAVLGVAGLIIATSTLVVVGAAQATTNGTVRVSTNAAGTQANGGSFLPSVSRDGRLVAFKSTGTNLHPADTNGFADVFVKDMSTGAVTLVSANMAGGSGNGDSDEPSLSADGRYVSFTSTASDLVPGDTNGVKDVFRRDLKKKRTDLISVANNGDQATGYAGGSSINGDGRFVAFGSPASNLPDGIVGTHTWSQIYLRDMLAQRTILVSANASGGAGNSSSRHPSISEDGRYLGYTTAATDLIVPDANGSISDIHLWDWRTGQTIRASDSNAGVQVDDESYFVAVSATGRYIAFTSAATNLGLPNPSGVWQVYLRDQVTGFTEAVSLDPNKQEGNGYSQWPSVSADGRYVAFESLASDLVALDANGEFDIFVRDRTASTTTRVSLSETGGDPDGRSVWAVISADGATVTFESRGTNVVMPDVTGRATDVYQVTLSPTAPPSPMTPGVPEVTRTPRPSPSWTEPTD
jgi:Tol biopolymer transport system component